MQTIEELKPVIKLCVATHYFKTDKVVGKESLVVDFCGITKQKSEDKQPFFENRKKVQVIIEMEDLPWLIKSMQKKVDEWAIKQREKINTIQEAFKK